RHTRSKRDWSSDVCSSDLRMLYLEGAMVVAESGGVKLNGFPSAWYALVVVVCFRPVWTSTARFTNFSMTMIRCLPIPLAGPVSRSEERRVGKERGSLWGRC